MIRSADAPTPKENKYGTRRRIKNAAEKGTGKAKEAFGNATDNDSRRAEGQADQSKAGLKNASENVKDAFRK